MRTHGRGRASSHAAAKDIVDDGGHGGGVAGDGDDESDGVDEGKNWALPRRRAAARRGAGGALRGAEMEAGDRTPPVYSTPATVPPLANCSLNRPPHSSASSSILSRHRTRRASLAAPANAQTSRLCQRGTSVALCRPCSATDVTQVMSRSYRCKSRSYRQVQAPRRLRSSSCRGLPRGCGTSACGLYAFLLRRRS